MNKIYYFTRTGDSLNIANQIKEQIGGEVIKIDDHRDWSGTTNFIKGGYHANKKTLFPIDYKKPEKGDVIYLCFPLWSSNFPPAIRQFLLENKRENIVAVPTSLATHLNDTEGFKEIIEVIGKIKTININNK